MKSQEIIIKASRKKEIALIFVCLLFVISGIFIVLIPKQPDELLGNVTIRRIVGVIGILFFGLILTLFTVKLSSPKKYGIKISDEGIYDNSKTINPGLIKWDNIEFIGEIKSYGQRNVAIFVNNPQDFVDCQPNLLYKKLIDNKPILISNSTLDIKFDELHHLLKTQFLERK